MLTQEQKSELFDYLDRFNALADEINEKANQMGDAGGLQAYAVRAQNPDLDARFKKLCAEGEVLEKKYDIPADESQALYEEWKVLRNRS